MLDLYKQKGSKWRFVSR